MRPVPRPIEVIQKRHVQKDVFLDKEICVPVLGQVVDVPINVETESTKVVPKYVKGAIRDQYVKKPVERIVEIPVPEPCEEIKIVKRERRIPKETIKEVEVVNKVEEIVDVPRYVYIEGPRTIIKPKYMTEYQVLPTITSTAPATYHTPQVHHLPPIYNSSPAAPQSTPTMGAEDNYHDPIVGLQHKPGDIATRHSVVPNTVNQAEKAQDDCPIDWSSCQSSPLRRYTNGAVTERSTRHSATPRPFSMAYVPFKLDLENRSMTSRGATPSLWAAARRTLEAIKGPMGGQGPTMEHTTISSQWTHPLTAAPGDPGTSRVFRRRKHLR